MTLRAAGLSSHCPSSLAAGARHASVVAYWIGTDVPGPSPPCAIGLSGWHPRLARCGLEPAQTLEVHGIEVLVRAGFSHTFEANPLV